MRAKSKGRVPSAASTEDNQNQCLIENSTGVVPPQRRVIAVGKFRADVLDYLRTLPAMACINDHFDFRREGANSVLACGFERLDGSEAVALEITLHDWRPQSSIPVLELCDAVLALEFSAENIADALRGRTILTARQPRELMRDLRELKKAASKLFDRIEDQANWLPVPDDVTVSLQWFALLPEVGR